MFTQLNEIRLDYTEIHKVLIVLSSLDASYYVLAVMLESIPQDQLMMAYLSGWLKEEESKRANNLEARSHHFPVEKEAALRQHSIPGILTV